MRKNKHIITRSVASSMVSGTRSSCLGMLLPVVGRRAGVPGVRSTPNALQGEPLARRAAGQTDVVIPSWQNSFSFSCLVFANVVAYSAPSA
jgi:hypothetical protein